MIKDLYDRLRAEIEAQKGIKVGKLTLTDDAGVVAIKVIPALQEIDINFTDSGAEPPPSDIVTSPVDTGDGIIIEWGDAGIVDEGLVLSLASASYNVYRKGPLDEIYKLVGEKVSVKTYKDSPLSQGTYSYYVVGVDANGKEGIPSKISTITI